MLRQPQAAGIGRDVALGDRAGRRHGLRERSAGPKPVTCSIDEAQYVDWDEWGKDCGYGVPKAPGALPPRISWEPCGPAVGLSGCKKLKVRAGRRAHQRARRG